MTCQSNDKICSMSIDSTVVYPLLRIWLQMRLYNNIEPQLLERCVSTTQNRWWTTHYKVGGRPVTGDCNCEISINGFQHLFTKQSGETDSRINKDKQYNAVDARVLLTGETENTHSLRFEFIWYWNILSWQQINEGQLSESTADECMWCKTCPCILYRFPGRFRNTKKNWFKRYFLEYSFHNWLKWIH